MGECKENPDLKTEAKCSGKQKMNEKQPPFLDDLVKWNGEYDDNENPSFFW